MDYKELIDKIEFDSKFSIFMTGVGVGAGIIGIVLMLIL